MRFTKIFTIATPILAACIIFAGVLMYRYMMTQERDIRALNDRVESLEMVNYHQGRTQSVIPSPK